MHDRIVPDLLASRVRDTSSRTAFCSLDATGAWQGITWQAYAARIGRIVAALRFAGLERGHRVGILAPTSLDWDCTQMACLFEGAAVAGIDPNYAQADRDTILRALDLRMLFVADAAAAAALPEDIAARIGRVVCFADSDEHADHHATCLPAMLREAHARGDAPFMAHAKPDDDALIVFSSGTTGHPKPIAYTHHQVLAAVAAINAAFPDIRPGTRLMCWLPLANLFQRIVNLCAMVQGATSYIIGDPKEVMRYVPQVRPHLMIGVPRFYEKLHDGVTARMASPSRLRSAVARWALATGAKQAPRTRRYGRSPSLAHPVALTADRLVLRRIRKAFGGQLRYFISGSAPMPAWLLQWFESIGIPVLEAYGVSEDIVPVAMNRPDERRVGTVGKPVSGQEVKLTADHEILVRGPGVFRRYLDRKDGGQALDADGYWATGDLGAFDADGFLRLTGRKSDAFKLATGRWVAPAEIEAALRRIAYVEHAVVAGAGESRTVAILAIAPENAPPSLRNGQAGLARTPPAGEDAVRRDIGLALGNCPAYVHPAGVLLTSTAFDIGSGALTANLKLRRAAVLAKFAPALAALHADLAAQAPSATAPHHESPATLLVRWA